MASDLIQVETSLGTLEAYAVDEKGGYPGIAVTLVNGDGTAGQVSWTEVKEPDARGGDAVLQTHSYNGVDEEPVTVPCDPKGEWMSEFEAASTVAGRDRDAAPVEEARDDAKWRDDLVVLEVKGDEALLFNPNNSYTPFILASNFNPEDKTWSYGSYMSDLLEATCALHDLTHPDYTIEGFTPGMVKSYIGPDADTDVAEKVVDLLNTELHSDMTEAIEGMYESGVVGWYVDICKSPAARGVDYRVAELAARQLKDLANEAFFEALPIRIDEDMIARELDRAKKILSGKEAGTGLDNLVETKISEASAAKKGSGTTGDRPLGSHTQASKENAR